MRIIKMGNINTYTNTCPECGCMYEYDDSDISIGYEMTVTGYYGFVYCPCCHKTNKVPNYIPAPHTPYPYITPLTMYTECKCDMPIKEIFTTEVNDNGNIRC